MALDPSYFGFMFMLPELWSFFIAILAVGNVEIKSSSHIPKSFLSTLESSIPKNAIKTIIIDLTYENQIWSENDILSLIRVLCSR
jgi:hypothetical protein